MSDIDVGAHLNGSTACTKLLSAIQDEVSREVWVNSKSNSPDYHTLLWFAVAARHSMEESKLIMNLSCQQ